MFKNTFCISLCLMVGFLVHLQLDIVLILETFLGSQRFFIARLISCGYFFVGSNFLYMMYFLLICVNVTVCKHLRIVFFIFLIRRSSSVPVNESKKEKKVKDVKKKWKRMWERRRMKKSNKEKKWNIMWTVVNILGSQNERSKYAWLPCI